MEENKNLAGVIMSNKTFSVFSVAALTVLIVLASITLSGVVRLSHPKTKPIDIISNSAESGDTYATDGVYVYINDSVIQNADPSTFHLLADSEYSIDKSHAYYEGQPISGADIPSFKIIPDESDPQDTTATDYAEDSASVYFDGSKMPQANPATFTLLGYEYSKDANNVYYDAIIVKGADPATFSVTVSSNANSQYDAKDKNHNYEEGVIAK